MTQKLFKYAEKTYGFVSDKPIEVNQEVVIGMLEGKDILSKVIEVIEERPEKGVYSDESKRRIWHKVKVA